MWPPEKPPPYWIPPPIGQLKLNVDAACFSTSNRTGIGAVLRDNKGAVVVAFTKRLASPFAPLVAETTAVREGLRLMMANGLRAAYVETDCLVVSKAINNDISIPVIDSVISDINSLLLELGSGSCHYIPRAGNEVAHTLAQESITLLVTCLG